jgi:hypothetical protein
MRCAYRSNNLTIGFICAVTHYLYDRDIHQVRIVKKKNLPAGGLTEFVTRN